MTLQKFVLVLSLAVSASTVEAGGRFVQQHSRGRQRALERKYSDSLIVEFELSYDFSVPGETYKLDFITLVPKSIPGRQNIISVSYSPRPSRIFDENSNRYARFSFSKPGRQEIPAGVSSRLIL